jgi:hypothetical protein
MREMGKTFLWPTRRSLKREKEKLESRRPPSMCKYREIKAINIDYVM